MQIKWFWTLFLETTKFCDWKTANCFAVSNCRNQFFTKYGKQWEFEENPLLPQMLLLQLSNSTQIYNNNVYGISFNKIINSPSQLWAVLRGAFALIGFFSWGAIYLFKNSLVWLIFWGAPESVFIFVVSLLGFIGAHKRKIWLIRIVSF